MFIIATIILYTIIMIFLGYGIGYAEGFKESKEIDDKIIEELRNKYSR
jgi:hypothetical protein